ncbi:reverse transcriptase domain-containing protein [Tanacetum coccineum]
MMERKLGEGYSFIKKKCFVCGSLSHLIRDYDFYEKKMVREAEIKKQRVFNTGNGVAKPLWNNANRVNHANHFVPRPVQLNTSRVNVNFVRANVNSVRQNVNFVREIGALLLRPQQVIIGGILDQTPIVIVDPILFELDHPLKNMEDRGIFDSGCSTYMTGNKDHLDDFEECKGGSVTFGGSKGINYWIHRFITAFEEINSGNESIIPSPKKGQREGKAVLEEKSQSKRTKKQIREEQASLAEIVRLQAQEEAEYARKAELERQDALIAKRVQDELELSETQKNRMAQVQEAAKYYTEEDWDSVRAKLEANRDLSSKVLSIDFSSDDFAKKMVELINEKKRLYKEQRERDRRNRPMTQAEQREYMIKYLKSQGNNWKMSQLKKLKPDELKEEFDKCVEKVEKFIPMNSELEASKLKRTGINLQAKVFKKQKITDVPDVTKDESVKREEEFKVQQPILRYNVRKSLARKGLQKNKSESARSDTEEDVEAYMDERVDEPSSEEFQMGSIPQGSAPAKIVKWQILKTGKKGAYQIIREDHTDIVYVNFQGLLNDLTRDDLKELYRLMMLKYGDSRPEEEYERVLWGDLKTMFDPPSTEDAVWSLTHQQKVLSWRYFHSCAVHCLTLEAAHIYMLTEVKYPLPSRVCQAMLEKKLIGDRKDETIGREAAVGMTWEDIKTLTKEELCPRNEIQKLETEFWCRAMVGAVHTAYTDRFHELARLVPHLVTPENKRIERYIYGLALQICAMVAATEPTKIQSVVLKAGMLTDEAIRNGALKKIIEKKGNNGEPSRDGTVSNDNNRSKTGRAFATITNPVRKEYTGMTPKCPNCNYHHQPEIPCRLCTNCNRFGHIAKDCRVGPRVVNARNPTVARGVCFEYGGTDHYKAVCPRLSQNLVMAIEGGQGHGNNGN